MNYQKQVSKEHYSNSYDSIARFVSYYNQKEAVIRATGNDMSKTILEIGKGNGLVSDYLTKRGYNVKTFDFAEDLYPDYVGDVTKINEIVREKFDIVTCFEILEHIEYKNLEKTLNQLTNLTKESLLISVPQSRLYFSFLMKVSMLPQFSKYISIPLPTKHVFDGEHYWELGKQGYSIKNFRRLLTKYFQLVDEYTYPLETYHRYFILKK